MNKKFHVKAVDECFGHCESVYPLGAIHGFQLKASFIRLQNSVLRRNAVRAILLTLLPLSAQALVIKDDSGHLVEREKPAQRIVSLAPHLTETLFAAGAGKQVVGVVRFSDYPEAAKAIVQVGTYKTVSAEAIIKLEPDLVIAWNSGNGPEMINRLRNLGLTVFVTEPRRLEDIARTLDHFGVLTGHEDISSRASDEYLVQLNRLRETYSRQHEVSVFYQVWDKPLQTLNGEHLISDVMRLCGGRNVFADTLALAPKINIESLLMANPEVIIASGMGEARPEWLDAWRSWPSLQAVRKDHLYFIPPNIVQRHTPRILQGAQMMCEQLQKVRDSRK